MKRLYPIIVFLLALLISPHTKAQVNLQQINTAYLQSFDSLAFATGTTADVTTLPKGWSFIETGTNANTTYATGTGSSNTGNTFSFGATGSTERAIGGLQSGSLIPVIGARFVNNTGSVVTSLIITYRGEQWRLGSSGRGADRLDFQYSLDATAVNNGTWTHVDQLDFNSPVTVGTVGALVGNDNSTEVSFEITGLNIEQGATFAIRWTDFNVTNSDDGLAIDNFSLTPVGVPSDQPNISFVPSALNFGDVNINTSATLQYEVIGANLTDSITAIVSSPNYSISTDGFNFSNTLTLSPLGDTLFVRFSPVVNGLVEDTIHHVSDPAVASLDLTGFGFDQASNIIPIAEARTKSIGTKVTVAGRITVANEHGNPAFVQDATGGIPVFDFTLANGVDIGDSVIVTGPIGVFNDQIQISGAGIFFTLADSVQQLVEPKLITVDQLAANEGFLVTVQDVEVVNKSFVFYPQSTERMTNGAVQADLRIDGDTDIPGLTKPQAVTDITGVVGRFRTNAQLLPRFREDIPGAEEPSTPFDSIPKSQTFDVVNWNLEFFGARREDYPDEFGPADEALQLENVKRVMQELNADIFAVQEVSNDSLFAELVSQLGKYAYSCSDRYSRSFEGPSDDFPPQKVCFVYDTTTVSLVSARALFETLYDSARLFDSSILPGIPGGNPSSFYSSGRLPYLATFNVTIQGVTETLSLINIHAKSGATADDRNRRLYDATVLKDTLDAHFGDDQLIVLGDLNDDLDQSIVTGQTSPYSAFVTVAAYVPVTKALSDAGARSTISFSDVIDHQIITSDLQEEFLNGSQNIFTPFQLIPNYGNTTTDHLAVTTRYAFVAPVVNFVHLSDTVGEESTAITVNLTFSKPLTSNSLLSIDITGNASAGVDFTTAPVTNGGSLQLNIPAGADSASFTITVSNDVLDELDEVAFFTIQPTTGITVGDISVFDLTIQDNDVPSISFAESSASALEGSGAYEVRLNLSTPPATDQSVTISVLDGFKVEYEADYETNPAVDPHHITLQIPAGSEEAFFTITPLADKKNEPLPETVKFVIDQLSEGLMLNSPKSTLFSILNVKKKYQLADLTVSPNPTSGQVRLNFGDYFDGILSVELRNENGKLIYSGNGTLDLLSNSLSDKLHHEKRGIYLLRVDLDDETRTIRVLKK
ncbi:MAG TPA: DUF5689 domain-containing protein [Cyclobacteriaceae bacterium]|nr:DUF5689 domain-containing protein [Cyclobacteriaceae bacterium]